MTVKKYEFTGDTQPLAGAVARMVVIHDDALLPDARLLAIAEQLSVMLSVGDMRGAPADALRTLADLPIALLEIAGAVRQIRIRSDRR